MAGSSNKSYQRFLRFSHGLHAIILNFTCINHLCVYVSEVYERNDGTHFIIIEWLIAKIWPTVLNVYLKNLRQRVRFWSEQLTNDA